MSSNFNYGGQAVIEGVMMRGQKAMVTAVRRPGGDIATDVQPLSPLYRGRLRRTPLVRGIIVLIEAMVLGVKSLVYSANVSLEEEEEEITGKSLFAMLALAVVLAVGLFFIAPLFLTKLANPYLGSSLAFHLVEGAVRLAFFIAYLWVISFLPDIKLVFRYHGAEHKAVNAYEAGVPLEVEAVRKYDTAHMRCGTSFLFVVMVIAILAFTFIGRQELWVMIASRIALIPVIAALSYEVIYFGGKHGQNRLVRAVLTPGLWLQSLTTGEPNDRQIEVALTALRKAVAIDEAEAAAPPVP